MLYIFTINVLSCVKNISHILVEINVYQLPNPLKSYYVHNKYFSLLNARSICEIRISIGQTILTTFKFDANRTFVRILYNYPRNSVVFCFILSLRNFLTNLKIKRIHLLLRERSQSCSMRTSICLQLGFRFQNHNQLLEQWVVIAFACLYSSYLIRLASITSKAKQRFISFNAFPLFRLVLCSSA